MQVLLLGGGGREHALARAIDRSGRLGKLWAAPGSDAIGEVAQCVAVNPVDPAAVTLFARDRRIDLVVIGPEAPLEAGVADALIAAGVNVFGPTAAAARLETSKGFAKDVCAAVGAPTAAGARFDRLDAALARLRAEGAPIVVKADGLAAGKGVTVAETEAEAETALRAIFATPGAAAVLEEKMTGEEASLFVLCDENEPLVFGGAQDHKRAFEGDTGPMTGGMGAYSPSPILSAEVERRAMDEIVRPVLDEMARRGCPYRGMLYVGLMIEAGRPRLVEFNARFGDPETQALLPLFDGDLLTTLMATATGALKPELLRWRPGAALTLVLAAKGYPDAYAKGGEIRGIDAAAAVEGVDVFHAATRRDGGRWLSNGGRVLNVTGRGDTLAEARDRAYAAADLIRWPDGYRRDDIGARALAI